MLGLDTLLENGFIPHLKLGDLQANPVMELQVQVPLLGLSVACLNLQPLISPLKSGP